MSPLLNDDAHDVSCEPQFLKSPHPTDFREANAFPIEFHGVSGIINAEGLLARLPFILWKLGHFITPASHRRAEVIECVSSNASDERLLPVKLGILPSIEFLLDCVVLEISRIRETASNCAIRLLANPP